MHNYAEQFRRAARRQLNGKRSPGRYPDALRELALAHLRESRTQGSTASQAARDLGIDANTLRGWDGRARRRGRQQSVGTTQPAVIPVRVRDGDVDEEAAGTGRFVVHGPSGVRVDCQTAADVAELFRVLA